MGSKFSGNAQVFSGLPYRIDESAQTHDLGEEMAAADGRAYRYVLVGASTALIVGTLIQSPAEDTGDTNMTPAAASVGDKTISITSNVTVTKNQYAGGYAHVVITPGLGQLFKIKSHPAASAGTLEITLDDPIEVALTTSSRIDLILNPYNGVLVSPTALSGTIIGVAVNDITAGQYGWIQTKGVASVLDQGGVTIGLEVVASPNAAGAVETRTDGALELEPVVGTAVTASASTEQAAIKLNIE